MKTTIRKMSLLGAALLAAVCLGGGISAWQNSALQVRAEETSYTAVTDEAGTLTGFYTADPIEGALYIGHQTIANAFIGAVPVFAYGDPARNEHDFRL